ncbi:uncharacterized protein CDAR_45281 [Caerostris darwini]|uniref:Uncharacterized protein n=1 Tax=Caerostris darwini TaxID=1538125 RepID=A0AAV4RNV7_9ARAC|nr:uncharacterized protein CDAR_45281 [Caerostris darwini]
MDFDRQRPRQKNAPNSDTDSKYYFSDVGDTGRQKVAKQLRRRKNPDESDAKEDHKGKSFPSDKREPKYQRSEEKEKNYPDQFQLRSETKFSSIPESFPKLGDKIVLGCRLLIKPIHEILWVGKLISSVAIATASWGFYLNWQLIHLALS